jgi:hypothetical protein
MPYKIDQHPIGHDKWQLKMIDELAKSQNRDGKVKSSRSRRANPENRRSACRTTLPQLQRMKLNADIGLFTKPARKE